MCSYIKCNTNEGAVFTLTAMPYDAVYNSFIRKAERENFAVFKFVPSENNKLYEWYLRQNVHEKLNQDIDFLEEVKDKYKIGFVISRIDIKPPNYGLSMQIQNTICMKCFKFVSI